jgi:hypothetical protein
VRQALPGKWRYRNAPDEGFDFNADGTCVQYGQVFGAKQASGTYRFLDDIRIEVTVSGPDFMGGGKNIPVRSTYRILLDDKELILVRDHPAEPMPMSPQVRVK